MVALGLIYIIGKLSDKIGFYKVMVLVCSPVEFSFALQYITTFGIVYRDV
jgi:hypothetical protein